MLDKVIGIIFEILFLAVGIIILLSYRETLEFGPIMAGITSILLSRFVNPILKNITKERE